MNYKAKPGEKTKKVGELLNKAKCQPVISIITPFYNGGKTLCETANTVFSQTYPFFEWIIINDESNDKMSLRELERISKLDDRIKVYHKKNGGPAQARDFGVDKSSKSSKYIFFLDCDDLMENTMIEVLYWTLETHHNASFAYTTMVNFGDKEFIWEKYLSIEKQKKENLICISSMIKKEDFIEVGGFGIKEKAMYEDWNLWLKLIQAGKIPIRVNAPLFWYRVSTKGEFSRAQKNHENAMKYINETAKKIEEDVDIIQYPRAGELFPKITEYNMYLPDYKKSERKKILFIFPWTMLGGADLFNLELIKRIDKTKFETIILTTLPNENGLRQEFSQYCNEFYDLTTFLERKDFINFVDYIVGSRKVDLIMISNSKYGYYMAPYLKNKYKNISIIDYIHSIDLKDPKGGFGRCSLDVDNYLDTTYCCNNFTRTQLINDFNKQNVKTIYIGTDVQRFDPLKYNASSLKDKYNVPKDKKIVSFIARLSDEKRPEMFVRIAKELLKIRNDVFFVIAGEGYLSGNIKNKIDSNFTMLGAIRETEEIYAISDITVNCSSLEGLALTSYESLAMNVPVISTDVGGQTELIDDTVGKIIHYNKEENCEVVREEVAQYVEAINTVLNDLKFYKKNCRNKILKKFTYNYMVKEISKEFEQNIQNINKKLINNGKLEYELAIESLFPDYYYCVNNYLTEKFGIEYDRSNERENLKFWSKLKLFFYKFFKKHNCVNEGKNILNLLYLTYHLTFEVIKNFFKEVLRILKDLLYFIKFLMLSFLSIIIIIFKVIWEAFKDE